MKKKEFIANANIGHNPFEGLKARKWIGYEEYRIHQQYKQEIEGEIEVRKDHLHNWDKEFAMAAPKEGIPFLDDDDDDDFIYSSEDINICHVDCGMEDYCAGGLCDQNGCYKDNFGSIAPPDTHPPL